MLGLSHSKRHSPYEPTVDCTPLWVRRPVYGHVDALCNMDEEPASAQSLAVVRDLPGDGLSPIGREDAPAHLLDPGSIL